MLSNSCVLTLFCITVLKLAVLLVLNLGECLLVIITVPFYWSLIDWYFVWSTIFVE